MAAQFDQLQGEAIFYHQPVVNDAIVSASWGTEPPGPPISQQATTSGDARALVATPNVGSFLLRCVLKMGSGQTRIGEARINVAHHRV